MTSPIFARAAEEWARMRMAYGDYLEAHMARAEVETNGNLLNAKARAAGVTQERLFTANSTVAAAYASEELVDFWRTHPRMTLATFESQWLEDQYATPYEWGADEAA